MRAIQEAGVKIDVVGGRGIGAVAAVLGAVDGGSQLWDHGGFWRSPAVETFYRWRWPFTVLRWLGIALLAVLAIPAAVILLGLVVYPIALVLGMAGLAVGAYFVDGFVLALGRAFSPGALPTWIPRLAALFSTLALARARRRRMAGVVAIAVVSPFERQQVVDAARFARRCERRRSITRSRRCGGC